MFTGIIGSVGQILANQLLSNDQTSGLRIWVEASTLDLSDVKIGDSIAINGACMTAVKVDPIGNTFAVDVSHESLNKTVGLDTISAVNLEKAMRLSDRLGGHLVSGHIDDTAELVSVTAVSESHEWVVKADLKWQRFIAAKGSITLHGASLTINKTWADNDSVHMSLNLIPHTMTHTTFNQFKAGDKLNLEVDLLARYIEQLMPKS